MFAYLDAIRDQPWFIYDVGKLASSRNGASSSVLQTNSLILAM